MTYSKKDIAMLYGFSVKTFIKQLRSIPDRHIYARIMQSEANKYVLKPIWKNDIFMKDEIIEIIEVRFKENEEILIYSIQELDKILDKAISSDTTATNKIKT